jgi:predicted nucleic acid-binding Zn ribbon protein
MTTNTSPKLCMACGKAIIGRADKKYCDDFCRNNYNNTIKADANNFVRNVVNALKKNRRILEELLPEGEEMLRCSADKLNRAGFEYRYHTHTYTNKKGDTYLFCFEYGYLQLEGNSVLIVKRNV